MLVLIFESAGVIRAENPHHAAASERLCDDLPARGGGRHRNAITASVRPGSRPIFTIAGRDEVSLDKVERIAM